VHVVLAIFIGVLYLSIIVISRSMFDNIVARHSAFREIELIASRDSLTELLNRATLIELLQKRLEAASRSGEIVAFILIDLDRFKDVNDTFGHQVGDIVLKEVGSRIKAVVRPGDEVARIGGDEFVVMVAGADENAALFTAQRICAALFRPFTVGMSEHICGASIGYAVAPKDGNTIEKLFRNADLALYEAKQQGRAQIVRHSATITERYDRRVQLEHGFARPYPPWSHADAVFDAERSSDGNTNGDADRAAHAHRDARVQSCIWARQERVLAWQHRFRR